VGRGKTFSVDLLGEAVVSESEAETYRDLYLLLAETLSREMSDWVNLSVKISSLYSRIGPVHHEDSVREVRRRLLSILAKVREAGGFVNLDMEMYSLKEITLDVFTQVLDDPEFHGWEHAGVALQAYLKCTEQDLRRLIGWAKERNRRITIRLVKGAYWEYETIVARQKGWEIPVFPRKTHTDANFERCVELALSNHEHVRLAVGSHNVRSIAKALVTAESLNVPRERYEFQMLYGMGEPIKRALKDMGFTVREYVPIGELLPGMAYLVRRLLENASNEGFLQKAFLSQVSPEALLAEPESHVEAPRNKEAEGIAPFSNEPVADFTISETRTAFRNALAEVGNRAGESYPAVIGGKEYREGEPIVSVNPARPQEVVGTVYGITRELADHAVSAARNAQEEWSHRAPEDRAEVLFRAAGIARRRRATLAAWQVREAGKNWAEADADVAEAIDYLEYYGREMIRLSKPVRLGDCPGEENLYLYRPREWVLSSRRGISPGHLGRDGLRSAGRRERRPLQAFQPFTGQRLARVLLLREGGAPDGALNFIPAKEMPWGSPRQPPGGRFHPVHGVPGAGLRIVEKAGRTAPGQQSVKRAVVEMGARTRSWSMRTPTWTRRCRR
jgi:RHH-type proline utilization regulon transcriptional repressor/proline dehydrogenase/delta 1-pyrroline-5-carboxylate dehydrogenase